MAKDEKKSKADDKDVKPKVVSPAVPKLDVRQETTDEVRVDAEEKLSYKDYARLRPDPIITVQRIIDRRAKPPEMKKDQWPNLEIKQVVLWGQLPKEPHKTERIAATARAYILHVPPARKPPPKGIGSMEPPGG